MTAAVGRHGLETSDRLGRHRWIIEHSLAWLAGYRRLTLRYERSARLFTESLTLTATPIRGDKKLTTRDKLLIRDRVTRLRQAGMGAGTRGFSKSGDAHLTSPHSGEPRWPTAIARPWAGNSGTLSSFAEKGDQTPEGAIMTTSRAPRVEIERVKANLAGLYATVAGVLIFNVAVFFEWATTDSDGFSGYEADSLWPYAAYLGLGFAAALLYAARRAYRRQHRGLTLASMAVGLATTLQCIAWLIDIPGAAEREVGDPAAGVWIGLLGALLWTIGSALLAKESEGDPEHDRVHTDRDSANRGVPGAF